MNSLAIIPARGGSKRIPRKNVREFHGRPILLYSIEAALESGCFETVMVSTDDEEIASLARSNGAEVPFFRSSKASHDYATTNDVVREVLQTWLGRGRSFDIACCIYPTAPFLTGERIQLGQKKMLEAGAKSLMCVVPFDYPVQRALLMKEDRLAYWMPEHKNSRSQDLSPLYHDAGQLYWFDVPSCLATGHFLSEDCAALELSVFEVQDIDTELDWKLAELKFKLVSDRFHQEGRETS